MPDVLRYRDIDPEEITNLLKHYQLTVCRIADEQSIPGSFWGDEEAGLIKNRLYLRADTPIHSILHEACHYICMDDQRRNQLNTDAGSDDDEENAVCYLQILLAQQLSSMGRDRIFTDMDNWGYSFRLGSSRTWFEEDAEDARKWLIQNNIIEIVGNPRFCCRQGR